MNAAQQIHSSDDRFAVIGAGAMGLSLAAMLGRRLPVTIVVRNERQSEHIKRDGARVTGLMQSSARPCVVASIAQLAQCAPLRAVFVATKTTAIEEVADELGPLLEELAGVERPPFVISFQNGIEPGRSLMQRLAWPRVLRMVLHYGATLTADHCAEVTLSTPPHFIGGPDATHFAAACEFAATFRTCGLPIEPVENIEPAVWKKGLLNAAMNPVAALTDNSVGEVLDSPARSIVARLIEEGLAVAAGERIELGSSIENQMWSILDTARPHTPSMVGDIRTGRPSEVGQLNRQIIEHAARLGIVVPTHELVTSLIDTFDWQVFRRNGVRHRLTHQRPTNAAPLPTS